MSIIYNLLPKSDLLSLPTDQSNLGFGQVRTNHMFVADYSNGEWHSPRIEPYAPFSIAPGALALHYGQTIFEGAKAFQHDDGEIYLFRYEMNIDRLNESAKILSMPPIPTEIHFEGAKHLLDIERAWCPTAPQSSMYLRPFMFATSDDLGIHPSKEYRFCIMISPSGPYYAGGFEEAVSLLVTKDFHRAVAGGTGEAKAGGNYAASLKAGEAAAKMGCSQVLYLDATNTTVEEAGSMNHYHVLKDGTFVIPAFTGTILHSITSRSVLDLARLGKVKAHQEVIPLESLVQGIKSGEIVEAGGFGTAAVISPVGKYVFDDGSSITLGDGTPGKFSTKLYNLYTDIQIGKEPAPEGWLTKIPHYKI